MLTVPRRKTKIGPDDQGRKMSLRDFEFVETEDGYHYELSRGIITVSNIANFYHALIVAFIRDQLVLYRPAHPGVIYTILTEMASKLLIEEFESERHPNIAVYLTKPKGPWDRKMWRRYVPELTVEVVTERSIDRDYVEKREEYWALGVKEYWIVDARRDLVVQLKRGRSDWTEKRLGPSGVLTTKLLPGFKLPVQAILDAAADAGEEDDGQ